MAFELEFEVRDYECDLQGIVNNSIYQNYCEHTRHQFIKGFGLDFMEMHKKGFDWVVVEANLKYKRSLTSGDKFKVTVSAEKISKIKYKFYQEIIKSDGTFCVIAEFITVPTINGKPSKCPEVDDAFGF